MKKIKLLILFGLFSTNLFCQTVNYNFFWTYTSTNPGCNPFVTNNSYFNSVQNIEGYYVWWKASHGAPSIIKDSYGLYTIATLDATWNSGMYSEGLFISSPFKECYYYDVRIDVKKSTGSFVGLVMYAANNISERTVTNCNQELVPVNPTDKTILGSNDNIGTTMTTISATDFLVLKNYSYLWFYSTVSNGYSGNLNIYTIQIVKKGYETVSPSTPTNFNVTKNQSGFIATWNASSDNVRVAGYQVYINGSLAATVSGTTYTYTAPVDANQIYSVKVRAFDPVNNFSSFTAEIPVYITPQITFTGVPTWLCNSSSCSISTANYANATYQWTSTTGLSVTNNSYAITATANSTHQGNATVTLTRTMTQNGYTDVKSATTNPIWIGLPVVTITGPDVVHVGKRGTYGISISPSQTISSYSWDSDFPVGSTTSSTFTASFPGVGLTPVNCTVTVGCGQVFSSLDVEVVGPNQIKQFGRNELPSNYNYKIYPNPTSGSFKIESSNKDDQTVIVEINIYDLIGRLVMNKTYSQGVQSVDAEISSLPKATYLVKIRNSKNTIESLYIVKQ